METKRRESRCKGRTKAGKPCPAAATDGGLCFFHANPNKASELGRIGGSRSKRLVAAESGNPLPTLDSAIAVRDTVARLIPDVLAGKVHPRIAASLGPLMNIQLHAIAASNLELQFAQLEKRLTRLEAGRDKKGDVQPSNACATDGHSLDE